MGMYISPVKKTDERETPDTFFAALDTEFHFTLDAAATAANTKCSQFLTLVDNALEQKWVGTVWLNPPYSQLGLWIAKAYQEYCRGATVVCLVPSATDTCWWHMYATHAEVRFIKGRIRFKGMASGAPFPSALLIFRHT